MIGYPVIISRLIIKGGERRGEREGLCRRRSSMHIAPCLILLAASACLLCEGSVIPLRSTLCHLCPPRAHGSDAPGDPSLSSEFPFHLSIRRGVGHTLRLAGGAIDYSKFNDLDGADEDELDKLTKGLQEENKALREHGLSKMMEEAERSVRQGLEDGPDKLSPDIMAEVEKDDDSAWLTVLGAMYISCGMEEKAESVWRRAASTPDATAGSMIMLARYLAAKKSDFQGAEELISKARAQFPDDEEAIKAEQELQSMTLPPEGEDPGARELRVTQAVADTMASLDASVAALMKGTAEDPTMGGTPSSGGDAGGGDDEDGSKGGSGGKQGTGKDEDTEMMKEMIGRVDKQFDEHAKALDPQIEDMKEMLARAGEGGRERAGELLDKELEELKQQIAGLGEGMASALSADQQGALGDVLSKGGAEAQAKPGSNLDRFKTKTKP